MHPGRARLRRPCVWTAGRAIRFRRHDHFLVFVRGRPLVYNILIAPGVIGKIIRFRQVGPGRVARVGDHAAFSR